VDVLVASVSWQNRVSQFLNVGFQGGVYLAHRVRLSANLILPTSDMRDEYSPAYDYNPGSTGYYLQQPAKRASLFYGATLGIVVVSTPTFVMAPGVAFSRTDVSDYGSSLAVALPFEWVTGNGLRLGLEFDAGRAFGGIYHTQCYSSSGGGSCGPPLTPDRPSGTSILLQFQLGFGFNHPEPLPPASAPPSAWPAGPPTASPSAGPAPAPG
jgi:hypothetical protein